MKHKFCNIIFWNRIDRNVYVREIYYCNDNKLKIYNRLEFLRKPKSKSGKMKLREAIKYLGRKSKYDTEKVPSKPILQSS